MSNREKKELKFEMSHHDNLTGFIFNDNQTSYIKRLIKEDVEAENWLNRLVKTYEW